MNIFHDAVQCAPPFLPRYLQFPCCSYINSRQGHRLILRNFILASRSRTWHPAGFEASELNTTHATYPSFLYLCNKKKKLLLQCLFRKVFLSGESVLYRYIKHCSDVFSGIYAKLGITMILFHVSPWRFIMMFKVTLKKVEFIAELCSLVIRFFKKISTSLSSIFTYRVPKHEVPPPPPKHSLTQTPEESSSLSELSLPLFGTPTLHMCRYRYYSAHKMPQPHLKVVSFWNTLAASKLGSRLCRQHRPGPPFAQRIPLRWGDGCKLAFVTQTCSRHENPQWVAIKRKCLFLSSVVIFQGN